MTLKFDGWPRKTMGHLYYTTSSFVHHFNVIGKFTLELQSGNPQFGSKLVIFLSCMTLKFEGWPWKKANLRDLIAATGLVILLKFDPNHRFFVPCDLEIWWMALENNRAPSPILHQALCIISNPSMNSNWNYSPETLNLGQNRQFFVPCDLEIWQMT